MDQIGWILGIVIGAGLIQGTTGFAFGLFSMGLLVIVMPLSDAVGTVSILSLASSLVNLASLRGQINWREAWPITLAALPATALGAWLITWLDAGLLAKGVAAMILLGCTVALWHADRDRLGRTAPYAHVAGALGGLFGGALSMGGPPVVLYTLLRGWDKAMAKGVMVSYFVVTGVVRVGLHIASGTITTEVALLSLKVAAPALLASWAGTRLFRRMGAPAFRYAITALLVLLAARAVMA
ncbi:MAG: sulfite exporter TauE/SafE family protein [Chloroflexota bacterium]